MQLIWATDARKDLDRFINFLIEKNPISAIESIDAIENSVEQLCDAPKLGVALDDGTDRRELHIKFGKNGYRLRYIPEEEKGVIYILRVWHSREEYD